MSRSPKRKSSGEAVDQHLNISLTNALKQEFLDFCDDKNLTQREALELLITSYKQHGSDQEGAVLQRVERYKRSSVLGWSVVESFSFHGSVKYVPDWTERTLEEDLVNYVRDQKWINCDYSFRLGRIPQLRLKHMLMVFYCHSEQKYVVQECMEIHQEGYYSNDDYAEEIYGYSCVFEQHECKIVSNFNDVEKHFGKFSSSEELNAVRRVISVEKGLQQMNQPF